MEDNGSTTEKGDSTNETQANKNVSTDVNSENLIPKSRFDQVNQQKKDAIDALKSVADELAEDVPDDMRDLIPQLPPQAQIAWIRAAIKKGIFNTQLLNDDGLDSKRPAGKVPADLSQMNPEQMIAQGYK